MSTEAMTIALFLCLIVRETVEFKWTTSVLNTTSCEGQDKKLVWNYLLEESDRIRQLQWYYNKSTLICYKSESKGFLVTPLYTGRVEQYGTSGIILKNVSFGDAGEYTLYPKLSEETFRNVQAILLTVYGPPMLMCKPVIETITQRILLCTMNNICNRQQLLIEWRIEGEKDPVGNDSHLIIKPSWTGEQVFCCAKKKMMGCHNENKFELCTPIFISSNTMDDKQTEKPSEVHTMNVPKRNDAKNVRTQSFPYIIVVVILLLLIIMLICAFLATWYFRKGHNVDTSKRSSAKKAEVLSKELTTHRKVRHPTDENYSDSGQNQNIQIVNHINIGGMFDWYTALKTNPMVLQEENEQHADPLYHHNCSGKLKDKESYINPISVLSDETT